MEKICLQGIGIQKYTCDTAVIGSGAAGLQAVNELWRLGQRDVMLITEDMRAGTSRNTGSDKQTYYKLTLAGGAGDSVRDMAQTLFDGQAVDGDIALCEAALSLPCFFNLTRLGVPFPCNAYGEYVGYKTDHDPRWRATSVGPYTSRVMTECLEKKARENGVPVLDHMLVTDILSDGRRVYGVLCLNRGRAENDHERFCAVNCAHVVFATGGPAGMYGDSVYPESQFGATGTAFAAGAAGKNLTEWQFGLASVKPRWNVSGSYMQALPRFFSTLADGSDEKEFLNDFFMNRGEMLSKVFLKGYQWPFDVRKVAAGSSVIDILVDLEKRKGRRVFLDYRRNPGGGEMDFSALSAEAREYLQKTDACFGTPYERLMRLNAPAVSFYREHGADLKKEPLEIALCVQHNNGGLAIDCWWETNVSGLYAVGEAAASHGVYRPGGSALNAGQAGASRAAQHIAADRTKIDPEKFEKLLIGAVSRENALCEHALKDGQIEVCELLSQAQHAMDEGAGAFRSERDLEALLRRIAAMRASLAGQAKATDADSLATLLRLKDMLLCQQVYVSAMLDYLRHGGGSRGSALYTDRNGSRPYAQLPERFTYRLDDGALAGRVQEVVWDGENACFSWRDVRPIPAQDDVFEKVWSRYRELRNR